MAEAGLATARKIGSGVIVARVEKIYQKLAQNPYNGSPDVARLDLILSKRGCRK